MHVQRLLIPINSLHYNRKSSRCGEGKKAVGVNSPSYALDRFPVFSFRNGRNAYGKILSPPRDRVESNQNERSSRKSSSITNPKILQDIPRYLGEGEKNRGIRNFTFAGGGSNRFRSVREQNDISREGGEGKKSTLTGVWLLFSRLAFLHGYKLRRRVNVPPISLTSEHTEITSVPRSFTVDQVEALIKIFSGGLGGGKGAGIKGEVDRWRSIGGASSLVRFN